MENRKKILTVGESIHKNRVDQLERRYPVSIIQLQWEDFKKDTLLGIVKSNRIDGSIVHTFKANEVQQIVDLHSSGAIVLALVSSWRAVIDPHLGWSDHIETFRSAGVPTMEKMGNSGEQIFLALYHLLTSKT